MFSDKSMENLMLKLANVSDATCLAQLERAASAAPWTLQQFTDCLAEKNPAYILWENDRAIGFVIYHLIDGQCEIYNIAVHPDFQKNGRGKYLLEQVIDTARARRCQSIFLEVRVSNQAALALYQKLGFNEIGIRRNYYKMSSTAREDAIMMAVDLFYD
ncbi:MAG: ribosomal-protein-alanine N-acetyltransferase [Gammaproteobacteria bacterium]|nr:ribosomal-protein-alanine N-acetyltransferase [Gammaproteobacteria bacterium]